MKGAGDIMKKNLKSVFMLIMVVLTLAIISGCAKKAGDESKDTTKDTTKDTKANVTESVKEEDKGTESSSSKYGHLTIGTVQPGPEDYYQTFFDRINQAAVAAGMNTYSMLSEYSTEKEMSNVEDLISQGVDAIAIFPLTSDSAQEVTKICNAAKMPIFIITTEIAEGEGVETCSITNDFYDMGKANGEWLIDNFTGSAKILEIQGALGTGIADNISDGFADAIASTDYEILYKSDCKWDRATAIQVVEDQISAGLDFNVVFVHNEDMCGGVVSVLEENNMLDKVMVITQNGSNAGFEMLKNNQIACTVTNSPSLVAGETVVRIMEYFDGTLKDNKVQAGVYCVDQSNYENPDTVTWDVYWALNLVKAYLDK